MLDDLGIEFYEPYTRVLDTSRGIPWTRWCVGGRMNIVHNCLDKWIGTPTDASRGLRLGRRGRDDADADLRASCGAR